jgi:hypothetical protein
MNHAQHRYVRKPIIVLFASRTLFIFCVLALIGFGTHGGHRLAAAASKKAVSDKHNPIAAFERIILTFKDNPATTQAVTWRTNRAVKKAVAEIAPADSSGDFRENAKTLPADTTILKLEITGASGFNSARQVINRNLFRSSFSEMPRMISAPCGPVRYVRHSCILPKRAL